MGHDYITSERFIHDELVARSAAVVEKLYELWKKHKSIVPTVLTWPAHTIELDDGGTTDGICALGLPPDREEQLRVAMLWIKRTQAYAVLLVTQEATAVKALLESPLGTRSWHLPIERSGDVLILGKAEVKDNAERLGLIWGYRKAAP